MVYLKAFKKSPQWTFLCREPSIENRIWKFRGGVQPAYAPPGSANDNWSFIPTPQSWGENQHLSRRHPSESTLYFYTLTRLATQGSFRTQSIASLTVLTCNLKSRQDLLPLPFHAALLRILFSLRNSKNQLAVVRWTIHRFRIENKSISYWKAFADWIDCVASVATNYIFALLILYALAILHNETQWLVPNFMLIDAFWFLICVSVIYVVQLEMWWDYFVHVCNGHLFFGIFDFGLYCLFFQFVICISCFA